MNELNQKSDHINSIVQLMQDISSRIGLLSLNAAIEASHHNDSGSAGFIVVANEVKELSSKSSNSIKRMATILHDLKSMIHDVHAKMNQANEVATAVKQLTDRVKGASVTTSQDSKNVVVISHTIHQSMNKLLKANENVLSEINSINEITTNSSTNLNSLLKNIENQNDKLLEIIKKSNSLSGEISNL